MLTGNSVSRESPTLEPHPQNKPQKKRVFLIAAAAAAFIFLLVFLFGIPHLLRPAVLEPFVKNTIEKQSGLIPSYEKFHLSLFPFPTLYFEAFELASPKAAKGAAPFLRSEQTGFRIALLPLLVGKIALAHVYLKNADVRYSFLYDEGQKSKEVVLNGVLLDLWNVRADRPIHFKMRGKFLSDAENISASGDIQADFTRFDPERLIFDLKTSVGSVDLAKLGEWWGAFPVDIQKGGLTFSGEVKKSSGSSPLYVSGRVQIGDFQYQLDGQTKASASGSYEAKFQAAFHLEDGSVVLQEGLLDAPFGGPFQVNGKGNVRDGSLEEFYIQSKSLRLEALPQYVLMLEEVMPTNLGFSGQSRLDFFAKGNIGLLALNGRIDLSDTALTYSKYFSKPSGVPLVIKTEFLLAAGQGLRGDFSTSFEQANLKGSIVGIDLATGDGEVTVLTNKFSVSGWEKYLIPLKPFSLSGSVKVLTSMKGNLRQMEKAQLMNNITFDEIEAKASNGAMISNLSGLADVGPLDSELKDFRFRIGKTAFTMEGKMFMSPNVRWLARLRAAELDLPDFLAELRKISEVFPDTVPLDWNTLEPLILKWVPENAVLKQVYGELAHGEQQTILPELTAQIYDGDVSIRGKHDFSKEIPESFLHLDVKNVNLAKAGRSREKTFMNGTLFLTGELDGRGPLDEKWPERLTGAGSFSVTNGEFHQVDLLAGLAGITGLGKLGPFQSGATRFHDVRGQWSVKNKKLQTDELVLISDDFQIEGAGDLGFDGSLNYRLSAYLMPSLARKIIPRFEEEARLGPIPLLVVGNIGHPSVRPDPMLIETFMGNLVRQQFSKISSRVLSPLDKDWLGPSKKKAEPAAIGEELNTRDQLMQSGFKMLEHFLTSKEESTAGTS